MVLAVAAVVLGVGAHVVGGGDASLSCLPLLAAALAGVGATLVADRVAGYSRGAGPAACLLGVGQLAMHLLLRQSLSLHPTAAEAVVRGTPFRVLGLSCELVAAHTIASAVLVILLLGTQRSVELVVRPLTRARTWLQVPILTSPTDSADGLARLIPTPEVLTVVLDDDVGVVLRH